MPSTTTPPSLRIAVASTVPRSDPGDASQFRAAGAEIRRLVREARGAGARLVHLPEGAICWPSTHLLSSTGPGEVGPADWDRFRWEELQQELAAIAALAGELGLWVVVGAAHRLTPPNRPHNSLYVFSDRGEVATRYDERLLSSTKLRFLYTPGSDAVTFEVDGVRLGCALGMEAHYPELFLAYERLDVDGVLFSSAGAPSPATDTTFAAEARGHAATNSYWVSYAVPSDARLAPSGILAPAGDWVARCASDGSPSLAVAEVDLGAENLARPWRRTARAGLYDDHLVRDDPRSADRTAF